MGFLYWRHKIMVARFHFEEGVYQQLLSDTLPSDRQLEVTEHVESCESCQSKLESISQQDISWDDVQRFLGHDDHIPAEDSSTRFDPKSDRDTNPQFNFLSPSGDPLSIGQFGRYEIREILGRGGMGIVLRGYDPALNRHSAIKVLAPELASHAAARRRFSREAKSAAAVVHEHVVPILTVDEHQGLPYLVMPVVEGRSLAERCEERGPLETKEILRIGMQVAAGLAAAHAQGLVHRDVKPANILLENGVERVMITDFGLARAADDANMTRSGVIAGTPQYMSPEQARGADIDHRSDLFSLGSVLYFMCCGRTPFRAETTMGVLHRIVSDEPRPIRSVNPDVPDWLESIILRLLAKNPDDRYQSAYDVYKLLGQWLAHLQHPDKVPPPEKRASQTTPPGRRFGTWTAGIVGLAFFFFASIYIILDLSKGTLIIESERSDLAIRIVQGDDLVERLSVRQGRGQTKVWAGEYIIEIDGEHNGLEVNEGRVILKRGERVIVTITESANGVGTPSPNIPLGSPAVSGASDSDLDGSSPADSTGVVEHRLIQVKFPTPTGMIIHHLGPVDDMMDDLVTPTISTAPCRINFKTGLIQRLLFTKLPGRAGLTITATLELGPDHPPTEKMLAHELIQLPITEADIEHVIAGNDVIKVVYLPATKFADKSATELETLLSSSLDPGIDPIAEADRRGTVVAILRFRGSPKEKGPQIGMPLLDAIRRFNETQNARHPKHGQPPLTDKEVIASIRWKLEHDDSDEPPGLIAGLKMIVDQRYVPSDWTISGGPTSFSDGDDVISGWTIELTNRPHDEARVHQIRRRFLQPPPRYLTQADTADEQEATDAMPLAAAISQFNASHRSIDGLGQPPLTEEEVIAAILHWKTRRNDAPVVNQDFEALQKIAETRLMPKEARFEVLQQFQMPDASQYWIWSVRIVMPQSQREGWTYAYSIREQFISMSVPGEEKIHWGRPAANGLQVGVRFKPANETYTVGQRIQVEYFFRAIYDMPLNGSLPNLMSNRGIKVLNSAGETIPTSGEDYLLIPGYRTANFSVPADSTRGLPIVIKQLGATSKYPLAFDILEEKESDTIIHVKKGESCRVRFVVPNFADNSDEEIETGEVLFQIAN